MNDDHFFFLAFNFDPVTGSPIIYRPCCSDCEENHVDDSIYDHFFRCIKEYDYIQCIPPIDMSKEIFGDMFYNVKE